MATRYGDMRDVWFGKAAALEKLGKYEKAIKHYTAILEVDMHNLTAYHNKGVALEKLGRHDEAAKCFDEERWRKETDAKIILEEELLVKRVWSRIIKNEGKLFKTKTGVIFSYRIYKNKIIVPQYLANWGKKPDLRVYGEGIGIKKSQVGLALQIVPVSGPTDLRYIVFRPSHLWGILHDERIMPVGS